MYTLLLSLALLHFATGSIASPTISPTTSATFNRTLYPLHMIEKVHFSLIHPTPDNPLTSTQFDYSSKKEGPISDVVIIGGINYAPFKYTQPTGLLPQSPSKAIVYNPLDPYSKIWTPAWSCSMGDSITNHFDLHSFYFGCALATADAVENRTHSCDIELQAFAKASDTPFAQQSFRFVAAEEGRYGYGNGSQVMAKAGLEGFTGVYALAFTIVGGSGAPEGKATALIIDNVDVTVFTTEPFTYLY